MFRGELNGKEIQGRGNICIHVAGSFGCRAETIHCKVTILQFKKKTSQGILDKPSASIYISLFYTEMTKEALPSYT